MKGKKGVSAADASIQSLIESTASNKLSLSLLQLQRAKLMASNEEEQRHAVEEAETTLLLLKDRERKLYLKHCLPSVREQLHETPNPPAPILVCRTHDSMVLLPAPWKPLSSEKVLVN